MALAYVVVAYEFFVTPLSFRWKALYGEQDCPVGYEIMGVDISHHQARIDWEKLRNAKIGNHPLSFVIVKATEGTNLMDENFNDNFYWIRENDLVRGAYHYYKPNADATLQAEFFLRQAHLQEGDLPPVLDVEERGNKPLKEFQKEVLAWLEIVQTVYGAAPIIYTGKSFKEDYLSTPEFDAFPLWIAHYYEHEMKYEGQWAMWQYTDCGKVDGIKGYVDCNIFNGDMKALRKLTLQSASEEPLE